MSCVGRFCRTLQIVLELAAEDGGVTSHALMRVHGLDKQEAAAALWRYCKRGFIEKVGTRGGGHVYALTDLGREQIAEPERPRSKPSFALLIKHWGAA